MRTCKLQWSLPQLTPTSSYTECICTDFAAAAAGLHSSNK